MNRIFSALIIFLSLVNYNKAYSAAVTPSSYINTVHSVMLCETGSSQTTCLNPVILGSEGTTGKSFDLSSTIADNRQEELVVSVVFLMEKLLHGFRLFLIEILQ